jgi:hypothetical protein
VEEEVRSHFGDRVFASTILRNVRLSETEPRQADPALRHPVARRDRVSRAGAGLLARHPRPQRRRRSSCASEARQRRHREERLMVIRRNALAAVSMR